MLGRSTHDGKNDKTLAFPKDSPGLELLQWDSAPSEEDSLWSSPATMERWSSWSWAADWDLDRHQPAAESLRVVPRVSAAG